MFTQERTRLQQEVTDDCYSNVPFKKKTIYLFIYLLWLLINDMDPSDISTNINNPQYCNTLSR